MSFPVILKIIQIVKFFINKGSGILAVSLNSKNPLVRQKPRTHCFPTHAMHLIFKTAYFSSLVSLPAKFLFLLSLLDIFPHFSFSLFSLIKQWLLAATGCAKSHSSFTIHIKKVSTIVIFIGKYCKGKCYIVAPYT